MRRSIPFALALLSTTVLAACGGSMNSMNTSSGVPMSLTIGDTPPSGVAVLFFEASITGASLQPSDPKKPAVSVMSVPVEVEFGHLQTDTAFLSLANVAPDTYASLNLTFGNAQLTIVNHSTAAIGSCAINTVCQLTPNFNPSSVTLSSAPFPITVDMGSVFGIKLDFNVNTSIQSMQNGLSINPTVTIAHLTRRDDADEDQEMEQLDDVDGQVTGLGTNQFTLTNRRGGRSFTINVDGNTMFEDFGRAGCTANPQDFTCVKMDQILEVKLSESGTGTMLAKRVEFVEDASKEAIKGTITSVDSSTQFQMVVFREEPPVNGISEGAPVAVTIAPNATFQVGMADIGEDGGFSFLGLGFSFASSADLMVGQDVQIRPGTVMSAGGVTTITTDLVRLWPSQVSGTVGSIDTATNSFTLTNLSPLFTVTTIKVQMLPFMNFEDFPSQTPLAVGNTVSVKGLLFNTSGTPTLVTRTISDHSDD